MKGHQHIDCDILTKRHRLEAGCNFSVRDAGVSRLLSNHAGEVVTAESWSCECDYYREVSAYQS
ncbi:MAG TPA: hypothetical protein V6C71_08590 [Coleofasciculaceae cyanobacterium]